MLAFGNSLVEVAFDKCSFPALLVRAKCCLDCFESVLYGLDQCRLFRRMMSTYTLHERFLLRANLIHTASYLCVPRLEDLSETLSTE